MKRRLVGVALLVGIVGGLAAACSDSAGTSAESPAAMPYAAEDSGSTGDAAPGGQGEKSGAAEKPGAVGERDVSQPGVDRSLVRTATVELAAADVGGTVDRARDIGATQGGYAGREEVREEFATLTLHIPSDRFDRALDELSALGEVTSRTQSAEDVTEQVVDLDSRVATQRASVDRVRALLARATTVDEIVLIEQEVTSREADLESLEQRRQALAGQVAMSTVTLRISTTGVAPAPRQEDPGGFLAGLSDGWGAFLDAGAGTLRVIGAVLPFLLLAVPAAAAVRWWRRRRTTAAVARRTEPAA
jgi:hypothetical protein